MRISLWLFLMVLPLSALPVTTGSCGFTLNPIYQGSAAGMLYPSGFRMPEGSNPEIASVVRYGEDLMAGVAKTKMLLKKAELKNQVRWLHEFVILDAKVRFWKLAREDGDICKPTSDSRALSNQFLEMGAVLISKQSNLDLAPFFSEIGTIIADMVATDSSKVASIQLQTKLLSMSLTVTQMGGFRAPILMGILEHVASLPNPMPSENLKLLSEVLRQLLRIDPSTSTPAGRLMLLVSAIGKSVKAPGIMSANHIKHLVSLVPKSIDAQMPPLSDGDIYAIEKAFSLLGLDARLRQPLDPRTRAIIDFFGACLAEFDEHVKN